jgi:hypothetical protein
MKGTRKNKQDRMRRQPPREIAMAITHPPPIQDYQVRHSTVQRFVSNAAASVNITFQNLLDTILMVLTATTAADVFYAVKVRRVEVWFTPVIGNAQSVTVQFASAVAGFVGDQKLHTDTSMGIEPAHVSAKPSSKSLASEYQVSSANSAFTLTVPAAGAVVDVHLSYVGSFGEVVAAQNAVTAGTAGELATRGLDGKPSATTVFPNISGNSV